MTANRKRCCQEINNYIGYNEAELKRVGGGKLNIQLMQGDVRQTGVCPRKDENPSTCE
jgi:hypothetical protein